MCNFGRSRRQYWEKSALNKSLIPTPSACTVCVCHMANSEGKYKRCKWRSSSARKGVPGFFPPGSYRAELHAFVRQQHEQAQLLPGVGQLQELRTHLAHVRELKRGLLIHHLHRPLLLLGEGLLKEAIKSFRRAAVASDSVFSTCDGNHHIHAPINTKRKKKKKATSSFLSSLQADTVLPWESFYSAK